MQAYNWRNEKIQSSLWMNEVNRFKRMFHTQLTEAKPTEFLKYYNYENIY